MKLYHMSHGVTRPKFRMVPRIPASCMKDENREIKRICVAPTIAGCLRGRRGVNSDEHVKIVYRPYRSYCDPNATIYVADAEPVEPVGVPDAEYTGELWLTKPTTFTKVGEINYRDIYNDPNSDITIYWHWAVKA